MDIHRLSVLVRMRTVFFVLAHACLSPLQLQAQSQRTPRPSDCASRLADARSIPLTSTPGQIGLAKASLIGCRPEAAYATASMIRRWAASSDTAVLGRIYSFVSHGDTSTAQASFDVAAMSSASTVARVFAFGGLLRAFHRGAQPTFLALIGSTPGGGCPVRSFPTAVDRDSVLSSSLLDAAGQLAATMSLQTDSDLNLRSAAFCVADAWREQRRYSRIGFMESPTGVLTVVAKCVDVFALRNSGTDIVWATYDAPGLRESTSIQVPGRPDAATYGESLVRITGAQQVRLLMDGVPFASVQASSADCAPSP